MDENLLDEICVLRTTPLASVPPFRAARVPEPDWLPGSPAPPRPPAPQAQRRLLRRAPSLRTLARHLLSLCSRARARFSRCADLAVKGSVRRTRIDLHCFTYSCICCCRIWDSLHMDTFFCRCSEQQQE
jgi:hypothetical protein